jgi:hypothetical protein
MVVPMVLATTASISDRRGTGAELVMLIIGGAAVYKGKSKSKEKKQNLFPLPFGESVHEGKVTAISSASARELG